jgi:hypothetical protein
MNPFGNPAALAHLHLLINHVPTVGTVLGIGLFLLAIVKNSDDLTFSSLVVFYFIALGSVPAYISGVAAHGVLQQRGDAVPEAMVLAHQSAALIALAWMELTGVVAWFGLWQARRQGRTAQSTLVVVFILSVISIATMAWAANLGGYIRHPEIALSAGEAAAAPGAPLLNVPAMGEWILNHQWMWPTGETIHFIGMSLSFGVLLVVNLYLLGFMPTVPFAAVHRLLPWGMLGLTLNVATGMMFFTGVPMQYLENPTFHWKVFFLVLVGLNYVYLTVFERPWTAPEPEVGRSTLADKALAFSSIFTWVAVMYLGRMLPYLRILFER